MFPLETIQALAVPSGVRAVTLDVGGTLIKPWPSVGHIYAEVGARFGLNGCTAPELNRRFGTAWKAKTGFRYTRDCWQGLVAASFGLHPTELPEGFFDALYDRFNRPLVWRVYADVLPALKAFKQRGLELAVISNWDDRLRPLLRGLGLDDWFDVMVISCEAGVLKPDPAIFQTAARQLNLPPNQILHLGDSRHEDINGARQAGFQARQIIR